MFWPSGQRLWVRVERPWACRAFALGELTVRACIRTGMQVHTYVYGTRAGFTLRVIDSVARRTLFDLKVSSVEKHPAHI